MTASLRLPTCMPERCTARPSPWPPLLPCCPQIPVINQMMVSEHQPGVSAAAAAAAAAAAPLPGTLRSHQQAAPAPGRRAMPQADGQGFIGAYNSLVGTVAMCGVVPIIISFLPMKAIRRIFPPIVCGVTIMLIGIYLAGKGMANWGGGAFCGDNCERRAAMRHQGGGTRMRQHACCGGGQRLRALFSTRFPQCQHVSRCVAFSPAALPPLQTRASRPRTPRWALAPSSTPRPMPSRTQPPGEAPAGHKMGPAVHSCTTASPPHLPAPPPGARAASCPTSTPSTARATAT